MREDLLKKKSQLQIDGKHEFCAIKVFGVAQNGVKVATRAKQKQRKNLKEKNKMKKKNWLMTIAFAVLALTIISTCVIGSTYARFTTTLANSGSVQAAGFKVGTTTELSLSGVMVKPGSYQEADIVVSYFSQVNAQITAAAAETVVAGGITTAGWSDMVEAYNTTHALDGYAVGSLAIGSVFVTTVGGDTDVVDGFIAQAKTAGLNVKSSVDVIGAMDADAAAAESITVAVRVTWASNYITSAGTWYKNAEGTFITADAYASAGEGKTTGTVTAAAIMDAFDTYLGGKIADYATANSGAATTIAVSVPITVTQYDTAIAGGWDA